MTVRAAGSYRGRVNLAAHLSASAARHGAKTALELDGLEVGYRALDAASARVAGLLRARGIAPGDRVGLMLPAVPELAIVYYGTLRAGAVAVVLRPELREREVAWRAGDLGVRLLFAWHAVAETAEAGARSAGIPCLFVTPGELPRLLRGMEADRAVCERAPGDAAVIAGRELTHGDLAAAALRHGVGADDVALVCGPLLESGALDAVVGAGASAVLLARSDAARARAVADRARVTVVLGEPATGEARRGLADSVA